ncbi:MAG: hypothetical protein GY841_21120, partial [FCB group bacterium]|nr:hypothetical protein [FCB group bacterium]
MLDKLKIISIDRILTFESPAKERSIKKADEIEKNGKLRNPLLARPFGDRYLLLDDTSILAALERLQISHIPIQIADPQTLTLHPWQRVTEEWKKEDLSEFCQAFPRQLTLHEHPQGELEIYQTEVRFSDKSIYRLSFASPSLITRADLCIKLLARIGSSFRVKLDYNNADPLADFPGATAVVYPPAFTIDDLSVLAASGVRLPHGLVRIDQPGRILGIDYSLSILGEPVSPEEKESFLRELIRIRMSSERVAYYDGYVLVFNN